MPYLYELLPLQYKSKNVGQINEATESIIAAKIIAIDLLRPRAGPLRKQHFTMFYGKLFKK